MKLSNLQIQSNLMSIDKIKGDTLFYQFYPGDFLGIMHPEYVDVRGIEKYLTPKQIDEYLQFKVCYICKRSCAGTCVVK